jgi:hypothetical protein
MQPVHDLVFPGLRKPSAPKTIVLNLAPAAGTHPLAEPPPLNRRARRARLAEARRKR